MRREWRTLTLWQILLVGKHHQQAISHLPVGQDPLELLPCFVDTVFVGRINDEDEALRVSDDRQRLVTALRDSDLGAGVVMSP